MPRFQIRRHDANTCQSSVVLSGLSAQDAEEAAAEMRAEWEEDEYAAGFAPRFTVEMQPGAPAVETTPVTAPDRAPLRLVPMRRTATTYRVTKTPTMDRPDRSAGIVAAGLTMDAAGNLAAALRAADPTANTEEGHVYRVWTAPLAEQVALADAARGMLHAADLDAGAPVLRLAA